MTYLITEIAIHLLIAFLIGLFLGWLFAKICGAGKCKKSGCNNDKAEINSDAASVSALVSNAFEEDDDTATISLDTNVDLDADAYGIETLQGIGPQTGDLFRSYGVNSVGDYLRKLHAAPAREQAAKSLDILVQPLHNWASMSDLLRVDGIDHQHAELAFSADVLTVGDLARSDAAALVAKMDQVNNEGKQLISPTVPDVAEVQSWIGKAKNMSPVVSI
jgi:hypothetical protein